MRRLLTLLAGVVLIWCLWWVAASWLINSATTDWFEDRRVEGWQADASGIQSKGFPARIDTVMNDIELADPDTGLAIAMDQLTLSARAIWPGDLKVVLPGTPIRIATPTDRWTVQADTAAAELNLHPGTALELEVLQLTSGPVVLARPNEGSVLGGEALELSLSQTAEPNEYWLKFDVTQFTPGDTVRNALLLPEDWPLVFDILTVKTGLRFDRPINRTALEDSRPQPQAVLIERAEAKWGDMRLLATGEMIRDAQGFADGHLVIKAENWQRMLDLAEAAGVLPSDIRPQIEGVMNALGAGTGQTDDLDVTLKFEGGMTRIGFIPLGPAPRLVVR